jgi:hypothetical protein
MSDIFKAWPKIPRVENRKERYSEKLDGTNACVVWSYVPSNEYTLAAVETDEGWLKMWVQSRSRLLRLDEDNYGFAKWATTNFEELSKLGEGHHFGEWWGQGIQRGYGQTEKKFSLFNVHRWGEHNPNTPECCSVVPLIQASSVEDAKQILIKYGSLAAPGYMNPEGVVVYESVTATYWKAIINK